ncbi:hypothetical protein, conserved [Angomonas deanei]|uniref:Ubiquitin-conjugating enzyme n=1 Tax=Angomonas deanei TaxID=59799 RepID=A0A7G2CTD6_9TRYP|nr:hypothetical protein, conserved [Angomonas deanei]
MPPKRGKQNKNNHNDTAASSLPPDVLEAITAAHTEEALVEQVLVPLYNDDRNDSTVDLYIEAFLEEKFNRLAEPAEEENKNETDQLIASLFAEMAEAKKIIAAGEQAKKNVIAAYNNNKNPSKAQLEKVEQLTEYRKVLNRAQSKLTNEKKKSRDTILELLHALVKPEEESVSSGPVEEEKEEEVVEEAPSHAEEDNSNEKEETTPEEEKQEEEEKEKEASVKEDDDDNEQEEDIPSETPAAEKEESEKEEEEAVEEEVNDDHDEDNTNTEKEASEPAEEEESKTPPMHINISQNNMYPLLVYNTNDKSKRSNYTLKLFQSLLPKGFAEELAREREEKEKKEEAIEKESQQEANKMHFPLCTKEPQYTRYNLNLTHSSENETNNNNNESEEDAIFGTVKAQLNDQLNKLNQFASQHFPFFRLCRDHNSPHNNINFLEVWHMDYTPLDGPFGLSTPLHFLLLFPYNYPFSPPVVQLAGTNNNNNSSVVFPHKAILSSGSLYNIKNTVFLKNVKDNANVFEVVFSILETFNEKGFQSTIKGINNAKFFSETVRECKVNVLPQARAGCTCLQKDTAYSWNYPLLTLEKESEEEKKTLSLLPSNPIGLPSGPYKAVYGNLFYRNGDGEEEDSFYFHLQFSCEKKEVDKCAAVVQIFEADLDTFHKNKPHHFSQTCTALLNENTNNVRCVKEITFSEMKKKGDATYQLSAKLSSNKEQGSDGYVTVPLDNSDKAFFILFNIPSGVSPTVHFTSQDVFTYSKEIRFLPTDKDTRAKEEEALKKEAVLFSPKEQLRFLRDQGNSKVGMLLSVPYGFISPKHKSSTDSFFGESFAAEKYYYLPVCAAFVRGASLPFLCEESYFFGLRKRIQPNQINNDNESYVLQGVPEDVVKSLSLARNGIVNTNHHGNDADQTKKLEEGCQRGFAAPRVVFFHLQQDNKEREAYLLHTVHQLYRHPLSSNAYTPPLKGTELLHLVGIVAVSLLERLLHTKDAEAEEILKRELKGALTTFTALFTKGPDSGAIEKCCQSILDDVEEGAFPSVFQSSPFFVGKGTHKNVLEEIQRRSAAGDGTMEQFYTVLFLVSYFLASLRVGENGAAVAFPDSLFSGMKNSKSAAERNKDAWAILKSI